MHIIHFPTPKLALSLLHWKSHGKALKYQYPPKAFFHPDASSAAMSIPCFSSHSLGYNSGAENRQREAGQQQQPCFCGLAHRLALVETG